MQIVAIIVLSLLLEKGSGGALYHRYPGSQLTASATSGVSSMSVYLLETISNMEHSSHCLAKCNQRPFDCRSVQWRRSSRTCELYSVIADDQSHLVARVSDPDYESFSLSVAGAVTQGSGLPNIAQGDKVFDDTLKFASEPMCWDSRMSSETPLAEEIGLAGDFIDDLAISSSSALGPDDHVLATYSRPPSLARFTILNGVFCWQNGSSSGSWLKYDFQQIFWITSITYETLSQRYFPEMQIELSLDDVNWVPWKSQAGQSKAIKGASGATILFNQPLLTRYFRVVSISSPASSTMLFGCFKMKAFGCVASCLQPMGMENLDISDDTVASSSYFLEHGYNNPGYARLNWNLYGMKSMTSHLSPQPNLIIDLEMSRLLNGIELQGCQLANAWVTSFRVQYKVGDNWLPVSPHTDPSQHIFTGNIDGKSTVVNLFANRPIVSRYIQVIPTAYSNSICYKAELLGCKSSPWKVTPDLAAGKPVSSPSPSDPLKPLSKITDMSFRNRDSISNCARVSAGSSRNRTFVTIDLGETLTIAAVELTTPSLPVNYLLQPDALWPLDIIHGGDDLSTRQNHAIIGGSGIEWGDGFDGRKFGALSFNDVSKSRTVLFPSQNVDIDKQNGWTLVMWLYLNSGTIPSTILLWQNKIQNILSDTTFYIKTNGGLVVNYNFALSTMWNEAAGFPLPRDKWTFVGFSVDCRTGSLRVFIDSKVAAKRYVGQCSDSELHTTHDYAMMSVKAVMRVSCIQIYRRALDAAELELAALCPGLQQPPTFFWPLNCEYNDLMDNGPVLTSIGSPSCTDYMGMEKGAVSFGTNDHLRLGNDEDGPLDLRTGFSIFFNFKVTAHGRIFGWWFNETTPHSWFTTLGGSNGTMIAFEGYCRGTNSEESWSNPFSVTYDRVFFVQLNRWYSAGVMYDPGSSRVFLVFEGELLTFATASCQNGMATNAPQFRLMPDASGSLACFSVYTYFVGLSTAQHINRCPITSTPAMRSPLNVPMDGIYNKRNMDDFDQQITMSSFLNVGPKGPNTRVNWFNGAATYTSYTTGLPNNQGFHNSSMTISIYMRSDTSSGTQSVFAYEGSGGAYHGLKVQSGTQALVHQYICQSNQYTSVSGGGVYEVGKWHHVAVTMDIKNGPAQWAKTYVDGHRVDGWDNIGWSCTPKSALNLNIGTDTAKTANFFNGVVTCFSMFQSSMSQNLMQEIASQCPAPTRLEGHFCNTDLTLQKSAWIAFSNSYKSPAGVYFNGRRLNQQWQGDPAVNGSFACCWHPTTSSQNEYVLVEFTDERTVTSIETQGDESTGRYISSFKIQYSNDRGRTFATYLRKWASTERIFPANTDATSVIVNMFRPSITAKQVKIIPWTWSASGIGLRFALKGCKNTYCSNEMFNFHSNGQTPVASSAVIPRDLPRAYIGSNFEWTPYSSDTKPYFQVHMTGLRLLTQIHVQGSKTLNAFITKYHLLVSSDTINFRAYTWSNNGSRIRIFDGPSYGPNAPPTISYLSPPTIGNAFRIVVDDFVSKAIGRFGFKGCPFSGSDLDLYVQAMPGSLIRLGTTNPDGNITVAESHGRIGNVMNAYGVSYGQKVLQWAEKPVSGRYLSVVPISKSEGYDMHICRISAYSDNAINLAYGKMVISSSDVAPDVALKLTDGIYSFSVGSAQPGWFRIDLGTGSQKVSKVIVTTSTYGWNAYKFPTATMKTTTRSCDSSSPAGPVLSCPAPKVIWIYQWLYGRIEDSGVCSPSTQACPGWQNLTLTDEAKAACHLKPNCSLPHLSPSYNAFDICPNVDKAGQVDWTCIDPVDIEPRLNVLVGNEADSTKMSENTLCDSFNLAANGFYPIFPGSSLVFLCTPPVRGRYVIFERTSNIAINIAEISVY